jgi:hypothetical protein
MLRPAGKLGSLALEPERPDQAERSAMQMYRRQKLLPFWGGYVPAKNTPMIEHEVPSVEIPITLSKYV